MCIVRYTTASGSGPACLSLLSPRFPHRGAGGTKHETGAIATYHLKPTCPFRPPIKHGAKLSKNKPRAERSDHHQATDQRFGMPARMLAG